MARFLYIIFIFSTFFSCEKRENTALSAPADDAKINRFPIAYENDKLRVENFFPNHSYNVELIEIDSLHPLLKITYSLRMRDRNGTQWVDAVINMPVTNEQQLLLRQLLYNNQLLELHSILEK